MKSKQEINNERLGKVVKRSLSIQGLKYTDIEMLTDRLWSCNDYPGRVSKNTISSMINGRNVNFETFTLQRLAPFILKVKYFAVSTAKDNDGQYIDTVGTPVFLLERDFTQKEMEAILAINRLDDLPLQNYRYKDHLDLLNIIKGQVDLRYVE
jgi:hypothetical protein